MPCHNTLHFTYTNIKDITYTPPVPNNKYGITEGRGKYLFVVLPSDRRKMEVESLIR